MKTEAVSLLTTQGWNAKSIAAFLKCGKRATVHITLKNWAEEQFAGIAEYAVCHIRGAFQTSGWHTARR